jgi:hypothetical protein
MRRFPPSPRLRPAFLFSPGGEDKALAAFAPERQANVQ